jgi:hypothetical protein
MRLISSRKRAVKALQASKGGEIDWLEDAGYILNSETTWQKLAAFSWIETRHAERPLTFLQHLQDFKQTVCPGS